MEVVGVPLFLIRLSTSPLGRCLAECRLLRGAETVALYPPAAKSGSFSAAVQFSWDKGVKLAARVTGRCAGLFFRAHCAPFPVDATRFRPPRGETLHVEKLCLLNTAHFFFRQKEKVREIHDKCGTAAPEPYVYIHMDPNFAPHLFFFFFKSPRVTAQNHWWAVN